MVQITYLSPSDLIRQLATLFYLAHQLTRAAYNQANIQEPSGALETCHCEPEQDVQTPPTSDDTAPRCYSQRATFYFSGSHKGLKSHNTVFLVLHE